MIRHLLCSSVALENGPFEAIARERVNHLLRERPAREPMSIVWLDVAKGRRITIDVKIEDGSPATTERTDERFEPVTAKSYEWVDVPGAHGGTERVQRFRKDQPKVLSITNLYDEILAIGKNDPGTLQEVSIFSHSFYNGPILVNSNDANTERAQRDPKFLGGKLRDPNDKDGRIKDFDDVNMTAALRAVFKRAFRPKGYVWVWGCNGDDNLHNLLRKIERSGGTAPTIDLIKLNQLTAQQIDQLSFLSVLLGLDVAKVRKTQRCEFTGKAFRSVLLALLRHCYPYAIASQTGVVTFGALPGTGAVWPGGKSMRINTYHRANATLYKRWLGLELDLEDRGYGKFEGALSRDEND